LKDEQRSINTKGKEAEDRPSSPMDISPEATSSNPNVVNNLGGGDLNLKMPEEDESIEVKIIFLYILMLKN